MSKGKVFVREEKEYNNRVAEFRAGCGFSVEELAVLCGCNSSDIVSLQKKGASWFYKTSNKRDGVSYDAGDVKPYVDIMVSLFDTTIPELFCLSGEVDRRIEVDSVDGVNEEWGEFYESERKMVFEKLFGVIYDRLGKRKGDVFLKRYFEDRTLEDISRDYGCGRENISQSCRGSLDKIKFRMGLEELGGLREDLMKYWV